MCNDNYIITNLDFTQASYPLEHIMETLKSYSHIEWFRNQTAAWNTFYQPEFVEVLTQRGFGFTFNMLPRKDLLTDK